VHLKKQACSSDADVLLQVHACAPNEDPAAELRPLIPRLTAPDQRLVIAA
jgi:hypothetical protein